MSDGNDTGFLRDPSTRALTVVMLSEAVQPLAFIGGFLRDATNALVITNGGQSS